MSRADRWALGAAVTLACAMGLASVAGCLLAAGLAVYAIRLQQQGD